MNAPTAEAIGDKFAAVLAEWLSPEHLARVRELNRAEQNPGVCHSHDYCDANMAMLEAFESFGIEVDVQDDEQRALWGRAWDHAIREHLRA